MVSRFAELHDGAAWVEERPGGGASFRVFLPVQPAGYRPEPAFDSEDQPVVDEDATPEPDAAAASSPSEDASQA